MTSEKTFDRAAIRAASEIKPVPEAKSHPDVIVLDTETTGLIPGRDHLLTVGVCDGEGREVLYLELCPPLECDAWPMAEAVNGISPMDVLDKPAIEDARAVLQGVLNAAGTIVCYNAGFDLKFLEADGFTYPSEVSDVMLDFAEIYGEYDPRHDDYKWQKLVKCAEYYGCPEFEAHNSLGDAQATAWCWRHVQRDMLARGGCDLEAEVRDASDASRGVPCPNDPDRGQSAR